MKEVIAMHGWCSDSNYWENWEKVFRENGWTWESADRGYTNKPKPEPKWSRKTKKDFSHKKVLISHSLGTHLFSECLIKEATHIVFINGFSRFIPLGEESRGLQVGLKGMQRKLMTRKRNEMISLFWEKAIFPHKSKEIVSNILNHKFSSEGLQKLDDDLRLLIKTQELPKSINQNTKVLLINGEKDKIVLSSVRNQLLKELSEYLVNIPEHWLLKSEGHVIVLKNIIEKTRLWLDSTL